MPEEQLEGVETTQEPPPRRGAGILITVIALVLVALLLGSCALSTDSYLSVAQRALFLADNAECLSCHAEVLAVAVKPSVHQPFITHKCESCHNPHAAAVTVSVTSKIEPTGITPRLWFRWGPFRWWVNWLEQTVLGKGASALQVDRQKVVGKATLVATPDTLCWTCHGNLGPEREMGFPHQPFAANNCVSCHNPHASDYDPLLRASRDDLCLMCHPVRPCLTRTTRTPPSNASSAWTATSRTPRSGQACWSQASAISASRATRRLPDSPCRRPSTSRSRATTAPGATSRTALTTNRCSSGDTHALLFVSHHYRGSLRSREPPSGGNQARLRVVSRSARVGQWRAPGPGREAALPVMP